MRVIGLPSSGVHSNGLTLARRALLEDGGLAPERAGRRARTARRSPTCCSSRRRSTSARCSSCSAATIAVHGLAHITGGGLLNLLRIGDGVGYELETPLPVPPVFELIASLGDVSAAEMWEVFNMGCGFCAIVPAADAAAAVALLGRHHPGTAVIGRLTADAGPDHHPGARVDRWPRRAAGRVSRPSLLSRQNGPKPPPKRLRARAAIVPRV